MKILFSAFLLLLIIVNCQNPTSTENSLNKISFLTDKTSYTILDSINIVLENRSNSDIYIGLRCGNYLEMFYQKKEDNVWSDNLWFWWMSLRCPTVIDSIRPNTVFTYLIKSEIFDTTGTYRLVIDFYEQIEDTMISKFSNTFTIK